MRVRRRPLFLAVATVLMLLAGYAPMSSAGAPVGVGLLTGSSATGVAPLAQPVGADLPGGADPDQLGGNEGPLDDAGSPRCIPTGVGSSAGAEAISRLGAKLPAVARHMGIGPAALREKLRSDPTLHVDRCGMPYYVEPVPDDDHGHATLDGSTEANVEAAAGSVPLPTASTFQLHSRPGAMRTIYLDFTGHQVVSTAWNGNYISANAVDFPQFDIDGNPASFSAAELNVIQEVWRTVSEDFAPLDVNVTTEDPGFDGLDRASTSDVRYGTRVLITARGSFQCICGGIAYVGVFDRLQASEYQPAFVFHDAMFNDAKNIAEGVTHEVGHNLNLLHHGTSTEEYYPGHGAWAPIMGTGYTRPITQWSRGEYSDANNSAQDDLSVMASKGAPTRSDDHGNSLSTATDLGATLPAGGAGEISGASDTDWFRVNAPAGSLTVSVSPTSSAPNLDAMITLYNSAGGSLASSNPPSAMVDRNVASGLSASLTSTVAAGTYYVSVAGVGEGNPLTTGYSNYGSVGKYAVSAAMNQGPVIATGTLPSTVAGRPYNEFLAAAGGSSPLTWSIASGSLPAGLSLGSGGTLSGTPSSVTSSTVTLRVTDSASRSSTRTFTLSPGVEITTRNLPDAVSGSAYSTSLTGAGGTSPYTWQIVTGLLPSGLSMSSGGVISGTTTATGAQSFTVQMTDAAGRSATRVLTLTGVQALQITEQVTLTAMVNQSYSRTLSASGGRPNYVWALASGTLPAGLALVDTGSVSGTPSTVGSSSFVLRVTDRSGRVTTKPVTFTVLPPPPTISSVSPSSGPTSGGTSVTVTGTNLTGATGVTFGAAAGSELVVLSSTQVRVVSPPGAAGTADVRVSTAGGQSPVTADARFTYVVPLSYVEVSVGDQSGLERDSVTGSVFVPVYLSEPASEPVTVSFYTVDGTALAGSDYTRWGTPANPRTVTIPAGQLQGQINVPVLADSVVEPDEWFSVVISSVSGGGAVIGRDTATATIIDSDDLAGPNPVVMVSNPMVIEGDDGQRRAQFQIHLSRAPVSNVTITYVTSDGDAVAGVDYVQKLPGTVVFAPGQISKTVDVLIGSDLVRQGDRVFFLDVAVVGGSPVEEKNMSGIAYIIDDD